MGIPKTRGYPNHCDTGFEGFMGKKEALVRVGEILERSKEKYHKSLDARHSYQNSSQEQLGMSLANTCKASELNMLVLIRGSVVNV